MSYRGAKLKAPNWVRFDFEVKCYVEVHGHSTTPSPLTPPPDTNTDGRTDTYTDAGSVNTRRPILALVFFCIKISFCILHTNQLYNLLIRYPMVMIHFRAVSGWKSLKWRISITLERHVVGSVLSLNFEWFCSSYNNIRAFVQEGF